VVPEDPREQLVEARPAIHPHQIHSHLQNVLRPRAGGLQRFEKFAKDAPNLIVEWHIGRASAVGGSR
jgi:hypothetical protein